MNDYLDVRYDGSDSAMLGCEYDFDDLKAWGNFDEMLKSELEKLYPGVEVSVSDGSHDTRVDTSLEEAYIEDTVREVVNRVWEKWLDTVEYK